MQADPVISADPATDAKPGHPELFAGLKQGVLIALAILALTLPPVQRASVSAATRQPVKMVPTYADFRGEPASMDAVFVANWVADSGDNRGMSFVIIDKKNTHVFVFDKDAKIVGATPVLLGVQPGDDSVIGIGKRPIAEVRPEERTTPAGRFVGEPGRNATGEDVVWVDYEAAVSMHRVRIVDPKERRLERLASETTDDNRISFGCVNIPVAFFENVLSPTFKSRYGVVYVLPEIKSVREVFTAAYEPADKYPPASTRPATVLSAPGLSIGFHL
jgi:hypothetical protein